MKRIKYIIKSIEDFLLHPIGILILVSTLLGTSLLLCLKLNKFLLHPYSISTIVIAFLLIIPLVILIFTVFFYIGIAISHINDYLSIKTESFLIFRKRRKLNFLKALLFILKSKKVRQILPLYLQQQIRSENKYFRKYRNKNKKSLNNALLSACLDGRLDEVQYLLISSELKENADINFQDHNHSGKNALSYACYKGHLDIVQYLLFSKELKENVNIANFGTSAFESAFLNEHIHILQYLVFEAKIEQTEEIQKIITECPPTLSYNIDNLFQIRELNSTLNTQLDINPIKKNKLVKV